ncbi:MAG: patatin family protein [Lachnospiraceae bacterium]|nr:patatin family protein [Lachnospiraceae bacterium]
MIREELIQDIEERISELRQEEKILSDRIHGLEDLLKQTKDCEESELDRLADRFRDGIFTEEITEGERPIPEGHASEKITEGCLVIEGGAFRGGAYDSGVLDCLMVNDINFQCVLGVSAGAITGLDYMSGQIGRSARLNIGFRHDPRYVGYKALYNDKSLVGFSFLYDTYNEIEPFDEEFFKRKSRRFITVATDMHTGKPAFFERGKCRSIKRAVRASASMPLVTKPVVMNGVPYLDGGCSDKIPYDWALEQDFEKIVVIRTREREYRKKTISKAEKRALETVYRKFPDFVRSATTSNEQYNAQCDDLERLEKEGRLMILEPKTPVTIGRLESDMEKIKALYWQGYQETEDALDRLREYLA